MYAGARARLRRGRNVSDETSIAATVNSGTVGVAGAQEVRIGTQSFINNFYSATPQAEIAKPTGPIPPCPYPGLSYFGPDDASRFFGREQAIQALAAAVAKRSFTALVGASGSGKSSVVLAGLAPRLETQGGWRSSYFRIGTEPDKNPFAALARALSPMLGDGDVVDRMTRAQKLANSLANSDISLAYAVGQCRAANPGKRILLIADQFEEVFTLVPDDGLRERFINALIEAFPDPAQGVPPGICLALTLRADFYNAALRYRPLADRLQDHVENLGPMTRDELREAIVKPAEAVGVGFEPGLVGTILDDVQKRPGSLPLLQFALREMWGRLKTSLMTRAEYDEIGGVEGALAKRAQAIFDVATDGGRNELTVALFRRLFTRLVALGEDAEDTRRIAGRDELGPNAWALAQKLADENNRLVVTSAPDEGKETAEVVHEALIRNWPTMMEWLNLDRAFITWRNRLKPRLDEWRANPSDQGTQVRGGQLATAKDWLVRRGDDLNEEEKAFISNGMAALETDQTKLERERFRSKGLLTATLTVFAILIVLFSYFTNYYSTSQVLHTSLSLTAGLIGFTTTLVLLVAGTPIGKLVRRALYLAMLLLIVEIVTIKLLLYRVSDAEGLSTMVAFSTALLLVLMTYAAVWNFIHNSTVLWTSFGIIAAISGGLCIGGLCYYYTHGIYMYLFMTSDVFGFLLIISVAGLIALDRGPRAESAYRQG